MTSHGQFRRYLFSLSITFLFLKCVSGFNLDPDSTVRLVTYNTGLTPKVGEYHTRRKVVGKSLKELRADVLCLNEVWYSKDMESILETVHPAYPYSYSALHTGVSNLQPIPITNGPCISTEFVMSFAPCLERHCRHKHSMDFLYCAKNKCSALDVLSQECITCMILTDFADIAGSCVGSFGSRFNVPGLLLLSSLPLQNVTVTRYIENKKLFIPRAYLSAEVEGVGTVVCTHTTAHLGEYFEDLDKYSNWGEQNLDEARALVKATAHAQRAVIMGDMNNSPAVSETDISGDFTGAYEYLTSHGYTPSYVNTPGICTWCVYNPLSHSRRNLILDHILTKNLTVLGTRRVMDHKMRDENFPLSDHFGIELLIQKPHIEHLSAAGSD